MTIRNPRLVSRGRGAAFLSVAVLTLWMSGSAVAQTPDERPADRAAVAFPFDVGDIPAGETLVLEFQATVPTAPVPAGVESVSNQATITATGASSIPTDDPDTVAMDDPTVTLVDAAPDLAIVKTVTDILDDLGATTGQTAVARPGNTIVYQLSYQNKASATQSAAGVSLMDTVPANTTFDSASSTAGWSCADGAPAGTPCAFTAGDLAPGDSGMAAFAVTIDEGLSAATTSIDNTAGITLPADDPVAGDNTSTVMTSLLVDADIAVDIALDQPMPIVGEEAIFTLTATNNGPEQATNVVLLDNIDTIASLGITGSMASAGMYVSGTGTWTLPSLGVGASETVTVTVMASSASGPTSATFGLDSLDQDDPNAANDNDAVDIEPKDADYGDAPDPLSATAGEYPTLLANDGARHAIPTAGATLFLGAAIDADADGQPNADATGDDTDAGGDDEDGVTVSPLLRGGSIELDVTSSAAGRFDAWIDFDGNGVWEPAEQIFTDEPVVAGTQSLTSAVAVPMSAVDETFLRARLSSAGGLAPTGRAMDGEVEDTAVAVLDVPTISVADATVLEGDPGDDQRLVFTVTRSANDTELRFDVATRDGSAIGGGDYTAIPTQQVTMPAGGALTKDIEVLIIEDNSVESDETLFLDLSNPVDATIVDGEGEGTIENDDFDDTPPTVASIDVVGQGALDECLTLLGDVSRLTVTFSEAMANAEDPAQYRLVAAGPDGDISNTACGAVPSATDREIAIVGAASDGAAMPTVTLDLAGAPRSSDAYRLLVCGTLTDEAGNALDGGAGEGTDLVRTFRVDRFNRFMNGQFDDCDPADVQPVMTGGWTLTPGIVIPDRDDADGAAISASVVADLATEETGSAVQLVTVTAGETVSLGSRFRLELDAGSSVRFGQSCAFFDSPDGTGPTVSAFEDVLDLDASTAGWLERETVFTVPAMVQSARCGMTATGIADGATPPMFRLFLDDLTIGVGLFSDGFESGDTSAWSSTVPEAPPPDPAPGDPASDEATSENAGSGGTP